MEKKRDVGHENLDMSVASLSSVGICIICVMDKTLKWIFYLALENILSTFRHRQIDNYIYISIDYELFVTSGNWLRQIFNMLQKQNCKCSNLCIHCIMHKNFYYPQGKDQI